MCRDTTEIRYRTGDALFNPFPLLSPQSAWISTVSPDLTDEEEERQQEVHFPALKRKKTRCLSACYIVHIQSQVEIQQC